jgi:RNA polymerase sigma-70 factor (ECF subfamily)
VRRASDQAEAFLALLRPLQRPLEAYCRRLLRDPAQAEDVLQAAVAGAFARFDRYAVGSNFRAWMFRFVTLEAFNRNRKREPIRFADLPGGGPPAPPEGPGAEDTLAVLLADPDRLLEGCEDFVADAIRALPAAERAVLLLRAVGELSYAEIHELLAIPLGSVIGYLSRARSKLRRALADRAARDGLIRRPPAGEPTP